MWTVRNRTVVMEILTKIGILFLVAGLPTTTWSQTFQCQSCYSKPGTCKEIRRHFRVSIMSEGYNPVVTLPAGACYINVTEQARSGNVLALKDSSGEYVFNGHWLQDDPGAYPGVGTVFRYSRGGAGCPGECFRATGPTTDTLTVQLLYHERNPGIYYSYQVPVDQRILSTAQNAQSSNKTPLNQRQNARSELKASEVASKLYDSQETSGFPDFSPVPGGKSVHRKSPIFTSEFKNTARINREHSETMRRRHQTGHQHHQADDSRRMALSDATFYRGVNDVTVRRDNTEPETNALPDLNRLSGSNSIEDNVDLYEGSGDDISLGVAENGDYTWHLVGYSECTRVCGGGIQEANYTCRHVTSGLTADEDDCAGLLQPEVLHIVCNDEPCTPSWRPGTWSSCSVTCGNGTQSRDVSCGQRVSATVTLDLADSHCTSLRPEVSKPCYMAESCHHWSLTAWTQCSARCGVGSRQREVICMDDAGNQVDDFLCDGDKPENEDTCDMGPCAKDWYFTQWAGQCSEDCESGVMTRQVYCATGSGQVLPDDKCAQTQKPSTERPCARRGACRGQWFTGPWSKCSRPCGAGTRRRSIVCMKMQDGALVALPDDMCKDSKPGTTEVCTQSPCNTTWYMTDWSQCSASCDGGTRTRAAQCLGQDMQASTHCPLTDRPDIAQTCNTDKCQKKQLSRCHDRYPNCSVVVKARLCRYPYYQRKCCLSCSSNTSRRHRSYLTALR